MLWREPFSTLRSEDVPLPPLQGRFLSGEPWRPLESFALLGAFDLRGSLELGVWERLMESAELGAFVAYFRSDWPPSELDALGASTPVSRHAATLAALDPEGLWLDLIAPDRPERAFAAAVEGHRARLLLTGAPTEDAWEAFLAAVRG